MTTATIARSMVIVSFAAFASSAAAQGSAPATPSPTQAPSTFAAVANPTYVSVAMEIDVNRPAAAVWARIGKFCDLAEWMRTTCTISAGKDGEVGAVRRVSGRLNEVLVGKTPLSYTYAMPLQEGRPNNLYHGTIEARPVTADTSKLLYTLMFDNSMLADDAARKADIESRRERFTQALQNMKILAEGGTLPPVPAGRE